MVARAAGKVLNTQTMKRDKLFQYCQKIVLLKDNTVLVCKRKGEQDYDGVYSLIGGKMEVSDGDFLGGLQREKNEEIGSGCKIRILPNYTYNVIFTKKDGTAMILPHYYAEYVSGKIMLSDEYSNYKWVPINELSSFQPLIESVPIIVPEMMKLAKKIGRRGLILI